MKQGAKTAIGFGLNLLFSWLAEEKPLRTWIRKRRAAKGRGPLVEQSKADAAVDAAVQAAKDAAERGLK